MTTLALLAPSGLYRDCLKSVLEAQVGIEAVEAADDPDGLQSLLGRCTVDVVIVDHAVSGGMVTIRSVAELAGPIPLVVFCVPATEHHTIECVEAGALGFTWQGGGVSDLIDSINGARQGELYCKPRVAALLSRRLHALRVGRDCGATGRSLTEREGVIVELIDQGFTNRQIADSLRIRVTTVKNHVHNILEKLHVHNRGAAAALLRGRVGAHNDSIDQEVQRSTIERSGSAVLEDEVARSPRFSSD